MSRKPIEVIAHWKKVEMTPAFRNLLSVLLAPPERFKQLQAKGEAEAKRSRDDAFLRKCAHYRLPKRGDIHACELCGLIPDDRSTLIAHHLKPYRENVILVCSPCHALWHSTHPPVWPKAPQEIKEVNNGSHSQGNRIYKTR